MMNKFNSAVLAGTALLALSATSANAATASGTTTARIVTPLTFNNNAQINFATIVPGAASDTVTVTPAGGRTGCTVATCSGTVAAAAFTVTGTGGQTVTVTAPAAATAFPLTSGANSMSMDNVAVSATSLTLDNTTGQATFSVGGTLNVGAAQAAGVYNGTFSVNVNYN